MISSETNLQFRPYAGITRWTRLENTLTEAPTAAVTLFSRHYRPGATVLPQAQALLETALERVQGPLSDSLRDHPRISGFLGRGYEAAVYTFETSERPWVMKVGLPKSCVPGLYSTRTDDYARTMQCNYRWLEETFDLPLPHLLPKPYFVVSPSELEQPTTVQFLPYIPRLTSTDSLTPDQRAELAGERRKFHQLSQLLIKNHGVIPDLGGYRNLVISQTDQGPHYALVDVGLYHRLAPTPLLNFFAYHYQRVALARDLRALQVA